MSTSNSYIPGTKRQRIDFVSASAENEPPKGRLTDVSSWYLNLVGLASDPKENDAIALSSDNSATTATERCFPAVAIFPDDDHLDNTPFAHTHSSIDRTRKGLKMMQKHGFDVDSGMGLGESGGGIKHPIKAKEKKNTAGLGLDVEALKKATVAIEKPKTHGAGVIRKMQEADKHKMQRLHQEIYGNGDVEKYLGRSASNGLGLDAAFTVKTGGKRKRR